MFEERGMRVYEQGILAKVAYVLKAFSGFAESAAYIV